MSKTRILLLVVIILCGGSPKTTLAQEKFDQQALEKLPKGWEASRTGGNEGSVWKLTVDSTSPTGRQVLTQTSPAGADSLFNICTCDAPVIADVNLRVSVKPLDGKIDQGGGFIWRYQNDRNYYLVRWNPLEGDFRLFHVINGKRTQLADTIKVDAKAKEWHVISVRHQGSKIECYLDDVRHFTIDDTSIEKAGRVGFWTKADAVTSFAQPMIASLTPEVAPTQVLVVNTQDASVSHVDLVSMKEISRNPVGLRPYGIAVSRDGKSVAVGVEDEECIKFFSLPDFKLRGKTPIGKMFNDHVVLTQDGQQILVANFYSDDIVMIDMQSMKEVKRISGCSAPHVVKYGPLKQRAFVTCKKITGVAIIDPTNQSLIKFHQLNVNPRSLTFSADESKAYFGSFWVNGFFEMDTETGKVTRLISSDLPSDSSTNQEVTFHGVEFIGNNVILAANEGRSFVDSVDVSTGKRLDRLVAVNKPCCVERVPGPASQPIRALISNIGNATLMQIEIGIDGKMREIGTVVVGNAPKRVAFIPVLNK